MPQSLFRFTYVILALCLGATSACVTAAGEGDGEFAIVSPAAGERIGGNAVRIVGTVPNRSIREVNVAGKPVPVSGGEFRTTIRLPDGPTRIEAQAGEYFDAVDIHVDGTAPTVVVDSPLPGSFVEGNMLEVRGRVDDPDAIVSVDGVRVALAEDGSFSSVRNVRPGAHRVRVLAEDAAGQVGSTYTSAVVGRFGDVESPLPHALSLALGPEALDAIGDGVGPHISPDNVRPLVLDANPVAEGFWGEVHAIGEDHGRVELSLVPGPDRLDVDVVVPNISVPFEARLLGLTIHGTAHVEQARIATSAILDAADGRPLVDLDRSEVMLDGVFIDVDGLWDWVDRVVVTRALRGTIESSLDEAIANEVPAALEAALADLPSSQLVELQGYEAEVLGDVAALSATQDGLRAVLDFGVRPVGGPGPVVADARGPLELGAGEGPRDAVRGVEGAITVDLINAALYAAWAVGGLSYRLDEVPMPDGPPLDVALVNVAIPVDDAPADTPVAVAVDAVLPPVVQPTATGLAMHAADLRVKLFALTEGGEQLLATVSCAVRAVVEPVLGEDGLGLAIQELAVTIDADEDVRGLPAAEDLDRWLGELLAPMLEAHGQLDGFQIPTVAGFSLGAEELFVDDGYVVFRGALAATN